MKIRFLLVPFALALGLALVLVGLVRNPRTRLSVARAADLTVCPAGPPTCRYSIIQDAVDAADGGDVIKVAAGTYTDVNDYGGLAQVVYVSKTVTIRGGYTTAFTDPPDPDANLTTLDAEGQGRVLYITGDISPTIEGLRMTGGSGGVRGGGVCVVTATAVISANHVFGNWANRGGGLCLHHSDAMITGNVIASNRAPVFGGGMYLYQSDAIISSNMISGNEAWWVASGGGIYLYESAAKLANNTISANFVWGDFGSGGGLYLNKSAATLTDNVISGNIGGGGHNFGGGLFLDHSDATIIGNTVISNTAKYGEGGGLYLAGSGATLRGNLIVTNHADKGGGLYLAGSGATLRGNLIVANHAGEGGGLELTNSDALLTSNVVADNRADTVGSGLYIGGSFPRLLHTTIARNSGGDGSGVYVTELTPWGEPTTYSTVALTNTILVSHTVGMVVTSSNTATLEATLWGSGPWANDMDWGGAGTVITGTPAYNYWGDPDFVDPDGGDYHIGSESAAIDKGVNAGVVEDVDGDERPVDGDLNGVAVEDLGADEFTLRPIYLPLVLRQ